MELEIMKVMFINFSIKEIAYRICESCPSNPRVLWKSLNTTVVYQPRQRTDVPHLSTHSLI
jgi:hypothetical protein